MSSTVCWTLPLPIIVIPANKTACPHVHDYSWALQSRFTIFTSFVNYSIQTKRVYQTFGNTFSDFQCLGKSFGMLDSINSGKQKWNKCITHYQAMADMIVGSFLSRTTDSEVSSASTRLTSLRTLTPVSSSAGLSRAVNGVLVMRE